MKNRRGFTLIELIGVITIIGLLLLIVFPSTMKLIEQNSKKKYNYYYDVIEKAALVYANSITDELGGIYGNGCVETDLATLIKENFVKTFEDEEVTCDTPESSENVKVKITNEKGKVKANVSLVCMKGTKVVYENNVKKEGSCVAYQPDTPNILVSTLKTSLAPFLTTDDNKEYFITGSNPNNYIWYSGKLWRVISFNDESKTIKLVTEDVISIVTYNKDTINYPTSNIYSWLNSHFISTLRDTNKYLINTNWNYTTVSNTNKPADTNLNASKVGMLNLYEYNKVKTYLNKSKNFWLLSPVDELNAWYVNSSNATASASVASFFGVRPSIVLKANVSFITGGNGSMSTPYRLVGDNYATTNAPLNTRYSGEYVYFAGSTTKYRIVSTDANSTKIIAEASLPIGNINFDDTYYEYSPATTLGEYLNTTWYNSLATNYKNMIYSGDFCGEILASDKVQNPVCRTTAEIRNMKVGIPKAGDYFSSAKATTYWTLNRKDDDNISCIDNTGTVSYLPFTSTSAVIPVVYIDKSVKITGGLGTLDSPFTISK